MSLLKSDSFEFSASVKSFSSNAEESETMSDDKFLAELPPDTPSLIGTTVRTIQSIIKRNAQGQYIVIEYVSPEIIERLVELPRLRGVKAARIFYHADLRKLILKLPSNIHEVGHVNLHDILRAYMVQQGVGQLIRSLGATRVHDGPYSKEPDQSYSPLCNIQGRDRKWPTLVIEAGYSERISRLRIDARWWLSRSNGQVKLAILLSIDHSRPWILLEKWQLGPTAHDYDLRSRQLTPYKASEVTVTLINNHTVITGPPLVLPLDDILLPATTTGTSFVISNADLERMGKAVWMEQGFFPIPD